GVRSSGPALLHRVAADPSPAFSRGPRGHHVVKGAFDVAGAPNIPACQYQTPRHHYRSNTGARLAIRTVWRKFIVRTKRLVLVMRPHTARDVGALSERA